MDKARVLTRLSLAMHAWHTHVDPPQSVCCVQLLDCNWLRAAMFSIGHGSDTDLILLGMLHWQLCAREMFPSSTSLLQVESFGTGCAPSSTSTATCNIATEMQAEGKQRVYNWIDLTAAWKHLSCAQLPVEHA